MAGQRSAGYCPNCNRGVSIVRPQRQGFMAKMKSALQSTDDDSDWVCTKCGEPATRGFAPPPSETPAEEVVEQAETAEATAETQPAPDIDPETAPVPETAPPSESRPCPSCNKPNPAMAAKCSDCGSDMNLPSSYEATCHLCSEAISFDADAVGTQTTCPGCSAEVILPEMTEDASALTRAPFITKLDDDPDRPEISKALCTQCNYELTYPKRLTGKHVDCPSCAVKFILP